MIKYFKQNLELFSKMPKKFDEILEGVKRSNKGKKNPRTQKPYTDSELYAIAMEQYKKWLKTNKGFTFICNAADCWEEEIVLKGKGTEKQKARFVSVIVSGLESDRQDERMSEEAIDHMIGQYKSGTIPFFSDHGLNPVTGQPGTYTWKGIMGVWVDAQREGNHLKATLRLNDAHPDSDMFYKFIKQKMPVGFSIGGDPIDSPKMVEVEA